MYAHLSFSGVDFMFYVLICGGYKHPGTSSKWVSPSGEKVEWEVDKD